MTLAAAALRRDVKLRAVSATDRCVRLVVCCGVAGACGPAYDEGLESCTAEDVPAISITALDAQTGAPVDGLSGLVRDGDYVDSLEVPSVLPGTAYAASERPGTYAVEVRAPGYAPWDTAGVVAPDNGCHVGRRDLRVLLKPARDPPGG